MREGGGQKSKSRELLKNLMNTNIGKGSMWTFNLLPASSKLIFIGDFVSRISRSSYPITINYEAHKYSKTARNTDLGSTKVKEMAKVFLNVVRSEMQCSGCSVSGGSQCVISSASLHWVCQIYSPQGKHTTL